MKVCWQYIKVSNKIMNRIIIAIVASRYELQQPPLELARLRRTLCPIEC